MILQSLAGLPAFLVYFCTAIIAVVAYLLVYTRITPHNEFQLIRDNDSAAAIALGLSLVGFSLPVVSAIAHSANVVDCLIWSLIALAVCRSSSFRSTTGTSSRHRRFGLWEPASSTRSQMSRFRRVGSLACALVRARATDGPPVA